MDFFNHSSPHNHLFANAGVCAVLIGLCAVVVKFYATRFTQRDRQ